MELMTKHFYRAVLRDGYNQLRYGRCAPKYAEKVYVRARDCRAYLPSAMVERFFSVRVRQGSGLVVNAWPEAELIPVNEHPKVAYCNQHWLEGSSWQQAGAYDYLMVRIEASESGSFDQCRNLADVKRRYQNLDELFSTLQSGGGFKSQKEIHPDNFREVGGIQFHFDPDGAPIFSGAGAHRLAIAQILDLVIPAQVGIVHRRAIPHMQRYRRG